MHQVEVNLRIVLKYVRLSRSNESGSMSTLPSLARDHTESHCLSQKSVPWAIQRDFERYQLGRNAAYDLTISMLVVA